MLKPEISEHEGATVDPSDADRLQQLEQRVASLESTVRGLTGATPAQAAVTSPPTPPLSAAVTGSTSPAAAATAAVPMRVDALWGPGTAGAAPAAVVDPAVTRPSPTLRDLEEQLSGRLLAWAGGIALVIGAAFFLSLAFSRGWIGPEARVVIGLISSAAAMVAGAWLFDRKRGTPAMVLTAVGIAVGMLALFAAAPLYGLIPIELALIGSLVIATGAALIAVRANSVVVAALGLLAATAAPPIMGGPVTLASIVLLGATLVGTSLIATYRPWTWLPSLAFVTTAPQLAFWLDDGPELPIALAAIAAYWLVNVVGAAGHALRRPRPIIHPGTALHMVGLALFSIGVTREVLASDTTAARLAADLALAMGFAVVAALFARRSSLNDPMFSLFAAVAVSVVVIAVALELGGIARLLSWAAIALALGLATVWSRRFDAAIGSLVVGGLVVFDLVWFIYPVSSFGDLPFAGPAVPFASPEGIAVLVIAGGVAALSAGTYALLERQRRARGTTDQSPEVYAILGTLGALALVSYAALFELRGLGVVLVWSGAAVAACAVARLVSRAPNALAAGYAGGAILVVLALWEAMATVAPPSRLAVDPFVASAIVPVVNEATVSLLAITAALVTGVALIPTTRSTIDTWLGAPTRWAVLGLLGAATVATYAGSIAVVDVFATRVDPANAEAAREIATQAQVALTIFWVVVGAAAFATGIVKDIATARGFGLGLLTLATLKLFVVDLATVEVAYRVLSFIGVGAILLGLSFLATKRRSRRGASMDEAAPLA